MDLLNATASADALVKDTTTAGFRQDVVSESMKQPVLVDFWAPWCGPCKQLTPIIEKAVKAAGGKVKLVKMNIDEHPQIPGQLGIQSIPAVIAFKQGQPVDGFMGALPDSQVKSFIERLVGPTGPSPIEEILAEADALAQADDSAGAAELYAAVLEQVPDHLVAIAALAKLEIAAGNLDQAQGLLDLVAPDKAADPAIAGARAALEVALRAGALGDLAALGAAVDANASDHRSRFDLALGLAAKGDRQSALDHLIEIIKRDRTWDDDGARRQLLQFFDAWGPVDEMTMAGRRKLSALLFR